MLHPPPVVGVRLEKPAARRVCHALRFVAALVTAQRVQSVVEQTCIARRALLGLGQVVGCLAKPSIGKRELKQAMDLRKALQAYTVGDRIAIRYSRDGKEDTATVELGER